MVQQRKFDRLEYKEKRLQEICREWSAKLEADRQFEPFYKAISSVVFSCGTKLKTRATVFSAVLKGAESAKNGTLNKSFLSPIAEDKDDDTISVYVFGEDETELENEARHNGGFLTYQHLAGQFGDETLQNMVQSRQRLHHRRQSIAASRRNSAVLPPPPAHLLLAAANGADGARPGSASDPDVRNSQACSVQ